MKAQRSMHRPPSTDRLLFRACALSLSLAVVLAACGGGDAPAEPTRPVLVVLPGEGPGSAPSAFAGEIRAREESPLSFRIGGQIVRRLADAGDRVHRGDVLAELDPGDERLQVDAAQAQLAAAEGELARATADQKRYAHLADEQLVSRSTLDAQNAAYIAAAGQARAARAQLATARNQSEYTQLRAPRDGVIATRNAEAGQTVTAGQAIYTLAGAAGREVAIALPESRIREFAIGQPVLVELWSQPGKRLPGRIREIAAVADPQARTYATRIALDASAAANVELGQSARVYIAGAQDAKSTALRLPLSALQRDEGGRPAVWVVDPRTNALKRVPVQVGAYDAESVPVLSGVRAGDRVVAAGGHLLREGQVVAPVDRDNRPLPKAR
jgi:multidrug efflux system membrane fusion protein